MPQVRLAGLLLLMGVAGCASIPDRPPRLSRSSYGCMQAVVRDKLPEDLPEKRAHCMASGLVARYCSIPEAYLAGSAKELRDLLSAGDAQWSDWQADRAGIDCARSANDDSALIACCSDRGY